MCEKLSEIIFNSISDGVFTVDKNCIITSFNKSAETITGFKASEAMGKHCFEVFRTEVCHKRCALKDTLKTEDPVENARVTIITRNGNEVPINVTTTLLKDAEKNIAGAVEFFRDISVIEQLQKNLDHKLTLKDIVSVNPEMQKIIALMPDIAESECNVLIQGPSGSGKELFAQVIHSLSPRRYGAYIKINCAALPAQLLESELFGYEKGAFTDAKRDKPGLFSLANSGTLLLDEISEMETSLQVKLLRVLNNGEYRPLGSSKTLHTDARIVAATNADLQKAIEEGRFREDLYYRINVVNILIPPLSSSPRSGSGLRTSPSWSTTSSGNSARRRGSRSIAFPWKRSASSGRRASPATSASWKTPSSTPSSCVMAKRSCPSTSPRTSWPRAAKTSTASTLLRRRTASASSSSEPCAGTKAIARTRPLSWVCTAPRYGGNSRRCGSFEWCAKSLVDFITGEGNFLPPKRHPQIS